MALTEEAVDAAVRPCKNYFLEMADWMNLPRNYNNKVDRILCPRENCGIILGFFFHNGATCSCGKSIAPAYMIKKHNVIILRKSTAEK